MNNCMYACLVNHIRLKLLQSLNPTRLRPSLTSQLQPDLPKATTPPSRIRLNHKSTPRVIQVASPHSTSIHPIFSPSHPQHQPSMLATPYHYTPTAFTNAFLPAIPSPLSPRSANVPTKPFMSAQKADASNTNGQDVKEKTVPFPKRPVKKAPSPTQNELKTQRRKLFLRKVAEGREEGRWERRGEDVRVSNQN